MVEIDGTNASRATRRPSLRAEIVKSGLDLLRQGRSVSLDSAAKAAGLTKPGLMYHFKTKEALVEAMVDHVLDGYERTFRGFLATDIDTATASQRMGAYIRWAVEGKHDAADLVMMSDPKLRGQMTSRWAQRLEAWAAIPPELPEEDRGRLVAVRVMADGLWFADATGVMPLSRPERESVLAVARELLDGSTND